MPNITILNGDETGKTYAWTAERIRIGRNSANDFVIANASVSGEHCLIERCEGGWRVKDLDSTNGTRLNNQRITMAALHADDVIAFGDIAVSIQGDDLPVSEAEPAESFDAIPRTTIVMRPNKGAKGPVEGFGKKSESKKTLNLIIGAGIVAAVALFGWLISELLA